MKIHLMSDLHLDHDVAADEAFLKGLKPAPDVDLLVLAGDWYSVCQPEKTATLFVRLLELYDQVVVVPGNHDYWRATPAKAHEAICDAAGNSARIHIFMEPEIKTIKGQRFAGGTLWYRRPGRRQQQRFVDMEQVKAPAGWFFQQQQALQEMLSNEPVLEDAVVVTHHLPTPESTPLKFRGSAQDHFFMCDMTKVILAKRPKLWLHGHTHDPCDYVVGATRVVCNPRGYPFEYRNRAPYEPKLLEV